MWGARGKDLGILLKTFWNVLNFNVIVGDLEVVSSFIGICNKLFNCLCWNCFSLDFNGALNED